MIKATLVVSKPYQENKIFDMSNSVNGKDNHMSIFFELKKTLNSLNIDLSTQDINSIEDSDIILYNDMPDKLYPLKKSQRAYLLALESIAVLPQNFNLILYKNFEKIFTWFDDIIDNKKILKINYSFKIDPCQFIKFNDKKYFLCMVSGNKYSNYKGELYYERVKLINYLENRNDVEFDLFGTNWQNSYKLKYYSIVKFLHKNKFYRKLFYLIDKFIEQTFFNKIFKINYRNFKGSLSPKIPKLRDYKFNICYENTSNINGYITEKIFDCFFAGCVPVYFGAPNISTYIPKNTFIDRRDFSSNQELINFLKNMSEQEYGNIQENISIFLNSDKVKSFNSTYIAQTISKEL